MPHSTANRKASKTISMAELAKRLSLSVGTVSQALNARTCVQESTRQRVVAAAAEMGYVPNRQAAALRQRKTRLIGLLVPTLSNPVYFERVMSAQQAAYELGYEISFASSEWRRDQEASLCRHFLGLAIDALIIDGHVGLRGDEANGAFQPLIDRGVSILQIAHGTRGVLAGTSVSRISIDVADGICQAISHLLELNHRHIGLVGIQEDPESVHMAQLQGVESAIKKMKNAKSPNSDSVRIECFAPQAVSMDSAYEAVTQRLRQDEPFPTALQAVNDQVALGVLKALDDHGLSVPGDVSLVGFDNLKASAFYHASLTTVSQTHLDLGRHAIETVIDRVENQTAPKAVDVKLKLIVRESTAEAPRAGVVRKRTRSQAGKRVPRSHRGIHAVPSGEPSDLSGDIPSDFSSDLSSKDANADTRDAPNDDVNV